jgi:Fe(3+) dicitrate transport protein
LKNNLLYILSICFLTSFAQKGNLQGIIQDAEFNPIPFCSIFILEKDTSLLADIEGRFIANNFEYGQYTLSISAPTFETKTKKVNISQELKKIRITLEFKAEVLGTVEIENENENTGTNTKMRSVEGVIIAAGKKSEVINLDKVSANKAANVGRQIYSRIPGLNIWESDGAGIQLGIGGRGLNPSRTSNFNTRQNGYDISADALGYPESYYTPPAEALDKIQLIRGAASLQFGTQFGGLLNFVLKEGSKTEPLDIVVRHTTGSFNFNNTFISLGGTKKTWNYYGFGQYKFGNEFRPNSEFNLYTGGFNIKKQISRKLSARVEFTKMYYLAHQPGGLTDVQFENDPTQSNRERNWFETDWNLGALQLDYEINDNNRINSKFFGLYAHRKALGFLGQINRVDPGNERDLITGYFRNFGNETRWVNIYNNKFTKNPWAYILGIRYYRGYNLSQQGLSNETESPSFEYLNPTDLEKSEYEFPSENIALFGEHIFRIGEKWSVTPGVRWEYIKTEAEGYYKNTVTNLAGEVISEETIQDYRFNDRNIVIGGIGITYSIKKSNEIYANFSQNYRSINFTDMQIQNPNFQIDPNLQDETGYNADIGVRGILKDILVYDGSAFLLKYDNRIGTTLQTNELFSTYQYRTNVSESRTVGIEAMVELNLWKTIFTKDSSDFFFNIFTNTSIIDARYINSEEAAFQNKKVELVPPVTFRTGFTFGKKNWKIAYQYSYTQEHFSDATNSMTAPNAVVGIIPSYWIMDLSGEFSYKWTKLEAGINNLANNYYFTRRATGYPGPGIIPSAPRNFYLGLELNF